MRRLITMGCLSYLLTGCTHVIWGAILPELLAHYGQSYGDGGLLVFMQFGGFLCGVLAMPYLIRRWSRRSTITAAFTLLALAAAATALLPPWPVTVTLSLTAGFAFGLVEASISTFVLTAAKEQQAVAFSKLEVAFGVGALIMPLVSSLLIVGGMWKYSFLVLGGSALVMAAVWAKLSLGEHDPLLAHRATKEQPADKPPAFTRSSFTVLLLFLFVFFMYAGMENLIVNFVPSIFQERLHATSSLAAVTVTVYWFAMVIGRIFAGMLAEKMSYFRYLVCSYAASLALMLLWLANTSLWGGFLIVLLLGLAMSGMFAVAIIFANQLLPGRTEQSTSLLIASGGLGGSVLPLLIGWAMDRFQTGVALWFNALGMLLVLAVILFARRWQKQTG